VEPNKNAYCAEPPGSPITVRGAQNAPFRGVPQAVPVPRQHDSQRDPAPGDPWLRGFVRTLLGG